GRGALLGGQLAPLRVGEQPAGRARDVLQVEPDRGGPPRAQPEQLRGEIGGHALHVLAGVDEGVRGGEKQRGDARDGAPEPDVGKGGIAHSESPGSVGGSAGGEASGETATSGRAGTGAAMTPSGAGCPLASAVGSHAVNASP